ncbi:MAG: DUF427 domain-containing protein [Negativicutes bacterium]|nr:DUF427 domain-containing protein [Negativicutes bacterium]
MVKAYLNDTLIAATDSPILLEGNYYFPAKDVKMEYLKASDHHTVCPWKGLASYYSVTAGGTADENAAWYYPDPKPEAVNIKDYIAFWHNVKVVKE